jgi:hypothetical protein
MDVKACHHGARPKATNRSELMKRTSIGLMLLGVLVYPTIAEASSPPAYVGVDLYALESPPGLFAGSAWGGPPVAAGQVIGNIDAGSNAILWNPPSGTSVNLHPTNLLGYQYSSAEGTDGVSQVGYAYNALGIQHGMLWHGTANSAIDLHPTAPGLMLERSVAIGVSGNQQVGFMRRSFSADHAVVWNGTPESAIDLHPILLEGIADSIARNTDGAQQVGDIIRSTAQGPQGHAVVWSGTPESAVDLNPAGFTFSTATGVAGGQQVGWGYGATDGGALLWTGTAASVINLNPTNLSGFGGATAYGTNGVHQVGYGFYMADNTARAMLWTGSPDSAVNLHALLPPGFKSSIAYSIDANGMAYGLAVDAANKTHAVKWAPVPEPASLVAASVCAWGIALRRPRRVSRGARRYKVA